MNPEMREGWNKEFRNIKKILPGSAGKALPGFAKTFQGPQELEGSWRNNNTQR